MDTLDVINQRRSVKAFDPNYRFTPAEETKLLEAVIQSPERYWRNASPGIRKLVTGWMGRFSEGKK